MGCRFRARPTLKGPADRSERPLPTLVHFPALVDFSPRRTRAMATSRTVSLSLPSSEPEFGGWGDRIQRALLRDRTLGYLFLFPAIVVIVGLVAYLFVSAVLMTFQA